MAVVTLLLAGIGPAVAMPQLLATALVGAALLALCTPVALAITVGLAVAAGLVLEFAYHVGAVDTAFVSSVARVLLLAAPPFG